MAYSAAHFDFSRSSSHISVDSKPASVFDDTSDVLVDDYLDSTIMSPDTHRRDSFSHPAGALFSPDSSTTMDDFPHPDSYSTNPFFGHQHQHQHHSSSSSNGSNASAASNTNNPFTRLEPSQAAAYGQQPSAWPWDESGACTPTTATYETFPQHDLDPSAAAAATAVPNGAPFLSAGANPGLSFGGLPVHHAGPGSVRPSTVFPHAPGLSTPASGKDWMAMAAHDMESRPLPKRMRPNTPPRPFSPHHQRRDGIRKKNARFEIPAERSLHNIDQLIAQSTNEDEIKELKQQKRLLRNRQAALDSRQRKKKHTEDLEEEKKIFTERMHSLEDELANLRIQVSSHMHEKEQFHRQQLEAQQIIETLQWEKEDLVRNHTLETGELRKKVSILTEKLENGTVMSAAPSSTGFSDFASDMDHLNMGPNEWDNYIFVDDLEMENAQQTPQQLQHTETALVPAKKKDAIAEQDKPVASGLLLMLLLCGAFVASKSSGTSPPTIPRMPDDVRAASATVLDSIFKDAGVAPSTSLPTRPHPTTRQSFLANRVDGLEPTSSGRPSWGSLNVAASGPGSAQSMLDSLHAGLTGPTADQQAEQLFGMTPAQYNSLTTADFSRAPYGMSPDVDEDGAGDATPVSSPAANHHGGGHRRNLAETLAAMREQAKGQTAAEVYTRSLLWERIPSEVVMEFKRMVEESGAAGERKPDGPDGQRMASGVAA